MVTTDKAEAMGLHTTRYKTVAWCVSAFFTAWAGSFWAMYFSSIRPEVVFGLLVNIDILLVPQSVEVARLQVHILQVERVDRPDPSAGLPEEVRQQMIPAGVLEPIEVVEDVSRAL